MPWRLRRRSEGREMDRQMRTETSIKSLEQSGKEIGETVWEQYDAAIGLIDLKPSSIKERKDTARSQSHTPYHCCHCPLGAV